MDFPPTIDTPDADRQYAPVSGDLSKLAGRNRLAEWLAGPSHAVQFVSQQTDDARVEDAAARNAWVVATRSDVDGIRAMDVESIMATFAGRVGWSSPEPMKDIARVEIGDNRQSACEPHG